MRVASLRIPAPVMPPPITTRSHASLRFLSDISLPPMSWMYPVAPVEEYPIHLCEEYQDDPSSDSSCIKSRTCRYISFLDMPISFESASMMSRVEVAGSVRAS